MLRFIDGLFGRLNEFIEASIRFPLVPVALFMGLMIFNHAYANEWVSLPYSIAYYYTLPVYWYWPMIITSVFLIGFIFLIPYQQRFPAWLFTVLLSAGLFYKLNPTMEYLTNASVFSVIITVIGLAVSGRVVIRGNSGFSRSSDRSFGDADWMSMERAGSLLPSTGGIVIGERYRVDLDITSRLQFEPKSPSSWGRGGKAPLLTFDANFGSTHMLFFAGSGGYKTTGTVIPTALRWSKPLVVLDPSREIAEIVKRHRETAFNREQICLDPINPKVGFNVVDWVHRSKFKEQSISTIAHTLLTEKSKNSTGTENFFFDQAHNLLTGVLAYIVLDPDSEYERTLRGLRLFLSVPDLQLKEKIAWICARKDTSSFIKQTLGIFINMTEITFSSVYSTATRDIQWLSFPEYASLVCGDTFKTSELVDGKIDVFINLSMKTLTEYPGIARVIVGSLINAITEADGLNRDRVLFMLDEVNLLGYMSTLETVRDTQRKYGVTLMLIYQSLGQLRAHFGTAGQAAWFESASLISFSYISDLETSKQISALCGELTIDVRGTSQSIGLFGRNMQNRTNESYSLQKRALIKPDEITQSMHADEQIIFVKQERPLRCGRAIYFRRPDMVQQADANRFAS